MKRVSLIGPGRLGLALALALSKAGYTVENIVGRTLSLADFPVIPGFPPVRTIESIDRLSTDVVFITTGDDQIASVATTISERLEPGCVLLHASGALASDVLAPAGKEGISLGSMHPLVSISDPLRGAEAFSDAYFCIEGDPRATETASAIAESIGGKPFSIPTVSKPLYHAAAVLASGHLTSLVDVAIKTLQNCGLDEVEARRILLPLIQSAVRNLTGQTASEALTGPFARGDRAAIVRHLEAFDRAGAADEKRIYAALGLRSLALVDKGAVVPQVEFEAIESILLALGSGR